MSVQVIAAYLADSGAVGTVLTAGTAILVALLAIGSAAGGFAAFKTGRTNAIAASAVARAGEAEATANTWKELAEARQAEFNAYKDDTARETQRSREALAIAEHEIATLQQKVATLEGVVTARKEISELITIVTGLSQQTGTMLATIQADHSQQHIAHADILSALGGKPDGT